MAEIELIAATSKMLTRIFSEVGIREFTVHINDRRILKAMAASAGFTPEQYDDVFIILDKMDKIGLEGVKESLLKKEYDPEAVESYNRPSEPDYPGHQVRRVLRPDRRGISGRQGCLQYGRHYGQRVLHDRSQRAPGV